MAPGPFDAEVMSGSSLVYLEITVPAALESAVLRHQAHLKALVDNLRNGGFDEQIIEKSLRTLTDSYRSELKDAIETLSRESGDA